MQRWRLVAGAGAAILALLLLAPLLPRPTTVTEYRIGAYTSATLYFLAVGLLVLGAARTWRNAAPKRLALASVAAFALLMALNILDVPIASDAAKLAFAIALGLLLLHAIEAAWWLIPVAVCVPIADAWSVYSSRGVTQSIVERAAAEPRWIDWPTIAVPTAGFDYGDFGRLGIVDILFLTVFVGSACRWSLGERRLALLLPLTFVAAIVLVNEGADIAVPALPLLCAAFLVLAGPGLWRSLRD